MEEVFEFNKLKDEDLSLYLEGANVFNLPEDEILKEKVELVYFTDEKFGSSKEKLDIAVYNNEKWNVLDIDDKVEGYNEIPLGYLLSDVQFSRILVIIRRMSTMVFDRKKEGFNAYILCKVPDKYRLVSQDKALFGLLAKNQVYLDCSEDEIRKQIQSNIVDRNEEICSRLF